MRKNSYKLVKYLMIFIYTWFYRMEKSSLAIWVVTESAPSTQTKSAEEFWKTDDIAH